MTDFFLHFSFFFRHGRNLLENYTLHKSWHQTDFHGCYYGLKQYNLSSLFLTRKIWKKYQFSSKISPFFIFCCCKIKFVDPVNNFDEYACNKQTPRANEWENFLWKQNEKFLETKWCKRINSGDGQFFENIFFKKLFQLKL